LGVSADGVRAWATLMGVRPSAPWRASWAALSTRSCSLSRWPASPVDPACRSPSLPGGKQRDTDGPDDSSRPANDHEMGAQRERHAPPLPCRPGIRSGRAIPRANMDRLGATVSHAKPPFRLLKCPVGHFERPQRCPEGDWGQGVTGSRRSAPESGTKEVRPRLPNTYRKPLVSR
jgi:hypothetical protein